jgi:threonine aldolase
MTETEMTALPTDPRYIGFASDNYAGVHPQVLEALSRVDGGYAIPYGEDPITAQLQDSLRDVFGNPRLTALPVFNGTGANIVALTTITPRWANVGGPIGTHANTDEGGALEHMSSTKIVTAPSADGKLRPEDLDLLTAKNGDPQNAQVKTITVSEATEFGTLYTVDELGALIEKAHSLGLLVHVDGTRLWNASVSLGKTFKEIITDTGADILSLGGTKVGAMNAEVVIVLNSQLDPMTAKFTRKTLAQLGSKQRYTSIQIQTLLDDDLGLNLARHANDKTSQLIAALSNAGVPIRYGYDAPVNACFPNLPIDVLNRLRSKWRFYDWENVDADTVCVRWMTHWQTSDSEVAEFAADIAAAFNS